jgi:hypothetical protein
MTLHITSTVNSGNECEVTNPSIQLWDMTHDVIPEIV